MHVCRLSETLPEAELGFVREAVEAALGEAEEVLKRHESEDPPLFDVQSLSDAAQDYTDLIATQRQRIAALKSFLRRTKEVK